MSERSVSRIRELLARAKGRRVLVLGAGVTGKAVSTLLHQAGYPVTVLDERPMLHGTREELGACAPTIWDNFSAAEENRQRLQEADFAFAVVSPGISFDGPLCSLLGSAGIPRVSEIDLAVAYLGMPTVAVTGTNGKTTTVHLIHDMLCRSGLAAQLVGNVGTPLVSLIDPLQLSTGEGPSSYQLMVAEVSSYQLESAFDFVPHIGVLLNVEDDHLERHGSFAEYVRIKSRIFSGQSEENWSVVWCDDRSLGIVRTSIKGRYFPFGESNEKRLQERGCYWLRGERALQFNTGSSMERFDLAKSKLFGVHNKLNLAAAVSASRLLGASHEAIQGVLSDFVPLPHRLELVGEKDGVLYINDSKATNISATVAALEALNLEFRFSQIILLLGGKKKEGSFTPLQALLGPKVKAVLGFGADGAEIVSTLQETQRRVVAQHTQLYESVQTLEQAVHRARQLAENGDIVMLSPACASFDSYDNYAERGKHFRALVHEVA